MLVVKTSLPKLLKLLTFILVFVKADSVQAIEDIKTDVTILTPQGNQVTGVVKPGEPAWYKFGINESTNVTFSYYHLAENGEKGWQMKCFGGSHVWLRYYVPQKKRIKMLSAFMVEINNDLVYPIDHELSNTEPITMKDDYINLAAKGLPYYDYNPKSDTITFSPKDHYYGSNFNKKGYAYLKIEFNNCYNISGIKYLLTVNPVTDPKSFKFLVKVSRGIGSFFKGTYCWLFKCKSPSSTPLTSHESFLSNINGNEVSITPTKKISNNKEKDPCDNLPKPFNKTYSKTGAGVATAARDLFEFAAPLTDRDIKEGYIWPKTGSKQGSYSKFKCGPHYTELKYADNKHYGPWDDSIPQKAKDAYKRDYQPDPNKNTYWPEDQINYLQCTQFVTMAYNMVGYKTSVSPDGGSWHTKKDMCAYKNRESKRYPEPGMGINKSGSPGHVALISRINSDRDEIKISEANTKWSDREFTIKASDSGKVSLSPVVKGNGSISYYFEPIEFVKEKCGENTTCLSDPCSYANQGKLN